MLLSHKKNKKNEILPFCNNMNDLEGIMQTKVS